MINLKICDGNCWDTDFTLSGHALHCPTCNIHLTSLFMCSGCGVRFDAPPDCTPEVMKHKAKVGYWLRNFSAQFDAKSKSHDDSKLKDPIEKSTFDVLEPNLSKVEFGSQEYKDSLAQMDIGLKRHYQNNRHHPQHFENGINGMTLYDLVEMYCDWLAAAEKKGKPIDIEYLAERFNISPQLSEIILNTLRDDDFWNEVNGVPVIYFTPTRHRKNIEV